MDTESQDPDGRTVLPTDFVEYATNLTGLEEAPTTLEEWWMAVLEQYEENDVAVGLSDLYSESPTRHEVHVDGRVRHTYCAMDALQAAVMEDQARVTVRSVDPVSATPVTFIVDDDGVNVSPEGALLCFGMNITPEDVEAVGSLAEWSVQDDKSEIQAGVCQYTNAFESETTYERWAAETDSVHAPLPPENVVPLLQKLPQDTT